MIKIKPRHQIIDLSVTLERFISVFLSKWLGIDRGKSRSLDSKGTSLSFNQQVNLILDMNVLSKEEANKLECFAQIRNKFAHIAEVKTYSDCLNSINGLKNKLHKYYPKVKKENADKELVELLAKDIEKITCILVEKIKLKNK